MTRTPGQQSGHPPPLWLTPRPSQTRAGATTAASRTGTMPNAPPSVLKDRYSLRAKYSTPGRAANGCTCGVAYSGPEVPPPGVPERWRSSSATVLPPGVDAAGRPVAAGPVFAVAVDARLLPRLRTPVVGGRGAIRGVAECVGVGSADSAGAAGW